jgi:hypothetical protein
VTRDPESSTLGISRTIIIALLGVLAVGVLIWSRSTSRRPRSTAATNICVSNLKQIDGAKDGWALENLKKTNAIVKWSNLIGTNAYLKMMPICPQGGTYTINVIGNDPTCSLDNTVNPAHVLPR